MNTFEREVRTALTRAGELYRINLDNVTIELNIRGFRTAGQACWDTRRGYRIRFHPDYIQNHYANMVKETIPHEVAHIICMMRPELGKNHDAGWKNVFRTLTRGAVPTNRCHTMGIERPVKAVETFSYKTDLGYLVQLTKIRHGKLQRGTVEGYIFKGQGKITALDYIRNK